MTWTVEDQLARVRKLRHEWIEQNGPCRKCGSMEELEMDHIDPKAKDPLLLGGRQNMWYWSKARREVELAKCQVLCSVCHKAKTLSEQRKPHCPQGHEMTPENTLTWPNRPNTRECRICKNDYNNKRRIAIRARRRGATEILKAPRLVEFS